MVKPIPMTKEKKDALLDTQVLKSICGFCGEEKTGTLREAIAWRKSHKNCNKEGAL